MDKPEESTEIDINEPVALTFALRYLNSFAKVRGCALYSVSSACGLRLGSFNWAAAALPHKPHARMCCFWEADTNPLSSRCFIPPQATPLSPHVVLKLSKDLPVVVEYHVSPVLLCLLFPGCWLVGGCPAALAACTPAVTLPLPCCGCAGAPVALYCIPLPVRMMGLAL